MVAGLSRVRARTSCEAFRLVVVQQYRQSVSFTRRKVAKKATRVECLIVQYHAIAYTSTPGTGQDHFSSVEKLPGDNDLHMR